MSERRWYKHWPSYLPKSLAYPLGIISGHDYLREQARMQPDKVAIIFYGTEITFKELDEKTEMLANHLTAQGFKKGDHIGILQFNTPEHAISRFAIGKMGGVACPINPMFKEFELTYQINDADMVAVIMQDMYGPLIKKIMPDCPQLRHVIYSNFSDSLPEKPTADIAPMLLSPPMPFEGGVSLKEILANGDPTPNYVELDLHEDLAILEYTGGTTGMPKGAMHSHFNVVSKPLGGGKIVGLDRDPDTIYLVNTPMFHTAGIVMYHYCIYFGVTMVILSSVTVESMFQVIDRHKVSNLMLMTPTAVAMAESPLRHNYDLSSVNMALPTSFTTNITKEIADKWNEMTGGCICAESTFGLAETLTIDTFMPYDNIKYDGCKGIPTFDCDIKVMDPKDRDKEMGINELGEMAIKNPWLMKGYYKNPEATAQAIYNGYLYTGDMIRMDEDGYIFFEGRMKEMIKVSGHSVFPVEVESMILLHPAIQAAGVIPVPDERKGEAVKAFLVVKPDYKGKITEQAIIDWCKDKMIPHKVPKYVEFRENLPHSGADKILRRVLKEEEDAKRAAAV